MNWRPNAISLLALSLACCFTMSWAQTPTPTPGCIGDTWTATSTISAPTARDGHTAVWTGSEMIVWGGQDSLGYVNTGGRYNPASDSWTATSAVNAPTARYIHTAVWTGNEMIVWGGSGQTGSVNSGGRYNPGTGSWTATSTVNAPSARFGHTAVWTGSEMIVWGGPEVKTGGRYNPITDTWTAMSTINAPTARYLHTAVWTGGEMIVWGGIDGVPLATGARYNPSTDTWTPTSITNAPTARNSHTAIWSGSEMIVWGGFDGSYLNSGGRYSSNIDSWTAISSTNAPSGRAGHTNVWTGREMIVWGGEATSGSLNTGSRYIPGADSWAATNTAGAPASRDFHVAVWTGNEMIVWGGYGHDFNDLLDTGGRYCGGTPAPTPTPSAIPSPAQALNISTRMWVDTGNNVLIGGFIITGAAPKTVAIRGIGPSLVPLGVPDALADPTLEVHSSTGTLLFHNDNWQDDPNQAAQLTALGLGLSDPNESGIVASLPPNAYTAILAGRNGGTGVGLVEVYDTNQAASSQLANISTRGFVLTGSNVMIGGFILGGNNNTHVVVRGIGPSLGGIPNALADPSLELHDSSGALLVSNDNWQDDTISATQLTALGLAPQNLLESGIYISLPPGAFTAILAGKDGGTGVGLVEVYNVH